MSKKDNEAAMNWQGVETLQARMQPGDTPRDFIEKIINTQGYVRGYRGRPQLWFRTAADAKLWIRRLVWDMTDEQVENISIGPGNVAASESGAVLIGCPVGLSEIVPAGEIWAVWPDQMKGFFSTGIVRATE